MIEPVDLKDFLIVFFVSAGVILSGTAYALCYAWACIRKSAGFLRVAYLAYVMLLFCMAGLAWFAHFKDMWILLAFMMAIGYFWAPRLIMKICTNTHARHP